MSLKSLAKRAFVALLPLAVMAMAAAPLQGR